nr:hypothetical protein [Bacillus mobilis]
MNTRVIIGSANFTEQAFSHRKQHEEVKSGKIITELLLMKIIKFHLI